MLLAILLLITTAGVPAAAAAAGSSLVVDAGTGRTLHAAAAEASRHPASLTKMMTLYLLFDALERGEVKPSTRMRVSQRAAAMPPTKLGLRPGGHITVQDAILALTTKSANDVAVVVAEALAGNESRFAQRMTRKAHALGMTRTTFRNASGLHHPHQRTTARDMATLARALLRDHPGLYRHFSTTTFAYRGSRYANHNRLLRTYRGVDGIKTGFTNASGYNLVASARRDGIRLIGVVLGSNSADARNRTMAQLLDRGFQRAAADRATAAVKAAPGKRKAIEPRRTAAVSFVPAARPTALAGTPSADDARRILPSARPPG
jgi:D-alanyl-D-alanine carboxypeptidase